MIELIKKYKSIIFYLLFGGLTTVVNVVSYWLLAHPLSIPTMVSTAVAWILAVLFAYVTNRRWVFDSQAATSSEVFREIGFFFACRLATGVTDWICMYIFVDRLNMNDLLIKIISNIIVVILNYIASKLIIFRKKAK